MYKYTIRETGQYFPYYYSVSNLMELGPKGYPSRETVKICCCKAQGLEYDCPSGLYPISALIRVDSALKTLIEEKFPPSNGHDGWICWTREPGEFDFNRSHQLTIEVTDWSIDDLVLHPLSSVYDYLEATKQGGKE